MAKNFTCRSPDGTEQAMAKNEQLWYFYDEPKSDAKWMREITYETHSCELKEIVLN